jgi:uncharacterized protein
MKQAALRLLLCAAVFSLAAYAQNDDYRHTVSVTGEGMVTAEPDRAIVRFGIVTRDKDPVKARQLNEEAGKNSLNAVRALGIEERKIRLTVLQLNEIREYDRERRRQISAGYQATREVVVELDNLDTLPALIAQVTQQGANRLHGLSYDVSNRDEVRNEALRRAVQSAREKAAVLAGTLGVELGRVIRIVEDRYEFPRPMPMRGLMTAELDAAADMGLPEAYAAGEIEVRASVQVIFGLE